MFALIFLLTIALALSLSSYFVSVAAERHYAELAKRERSDFEHSADYDLWS